CSDFEQKRKEDSSYYCKHILAALADFEAEQSCVSATKSDTTEQPNGKVGSPSKPNGIAKVPIAFPVKQVSTPSTQTHMLIKRSLSGDGRIDSISVEIDFGLADEDETVIKTQALKALKLQDTIIKEFIGVDQTKEDLPEPPQVVAPAVNVPEETVDAIMTKVGITQSKSFYITFELPEGKTAKLFGNQKYLSNQIAVAGFSFPAEKIVEGIVLNIPCRVTTILNGKFINVDRVFSL
ncbi:MAG: hypothetical protein FD167_4915, partial [bacterium]